MKKTILPLLAALLAAVLLCACGQSAEAKAADALIAAIGEVTTDSGDAIDAAERAVNALSEEDRQSLKNLDALAEAGQRYQEALDEAEIQRVDAQILALAPVTADSAEAIRAARAAYEALDSALRARVSHAESLTAAEAAYVENLITAIGTVTTDSGDAVAAARAAYDALDEAARSRVKNADTLAEAERAYHLAVLKEEAGRIEALISAIGTVDLDSEALIAAAQEAYAAASEEVRALVENAGEIQAARDALTALRTEGVEALIDAIGKVSAKSGDAIAAARDALAALSPEEAEQVENREALEAAETSYTELLRSDALATLKGFHLDDDRINSRKWYYASAWSFYNNGLWAADKRCFALPYLGLDDKDNVWLRMVYNYTGSDWVFFEKVILLVDEERHEFSFSYYDVVRDNQGRKVWEYVDTPVDASLRELLAAIADSKETIIRFQGDDHYRDFTVTKGDKTAIRQTLSSYEAMGAAGYKLS